MSDAALVSLTKIAVPCESATGNCTVYGTVVIDTTNKVANFICAHEQHGDWLKQKNSFIKDGWKVRFEPYPGYEHYKLY